MVNVKAPGVNEGRWISKYSDLKVEEMVLPDSIKNRIQSFLQIENNVYKIPNILLAGSPGCGKTTIAYAIAKSIGVKPYFINASVDNGIQILRDELAAYCSTPSVVSKITGKIAKKVVILDEIDNTTTSFKEGFKSFVEKYGGNVTFILTCNDITSFTQPILSRFKGGYINFNESFSNLSDDEFKKFKQDTVDYIVSVLKREGIPESKYDINIIGEVVDDNFPDIRYCLNDIQAIYDEKGEIKSYNKITVDMKDLLSRNLRSLSDFMDKFQSHDRIVKEIHQHILDMNNIKVYMIYCDSLAQYKSDFVNRKAIVINMINTIKMFS